jgi:hypothetical protein
MKDQSDGGDRRVLVGDKTGSVVVMLWPIVFH